MSNKFLNRNVNATFNVFGLTYRHNENQINTDFKYNNEETIRSYHNSRERFNFKTKFEDDKTVDSDVESIILDLNKLGGLSSSSSLSWSDDYEAETTRKVYDELKRLDMVLKGEVPIPSNYDEEECKEWMDCFPNLCIFDNDETPTNSVEDLSWNKNVSQIEETPLQYDCDMILVGDQKSNRLHIPSPKMIKSNQGTLLVSEKRLLKGPNGFIDNNLFFISKPKSLDVDQYLKVSPVLHSKRKQSSKSLMNRKMSRESPDNHCEYSSLPHIKVDSLPSLKLQKCSQQIKKKTPYSKTGRNDNLLILPPIDIEQFRSVSAIPNENFKTLSALSVNLNNRQKLQKKKHSSEPVKNLLSCRRPRNFLQ